MEDYYAERLAEEKLRRCCEIASRASSSDWMQQIFTLGVMEIL
jgi:hypothetical protein